MKQLEVGISGALDETELARALAGPAPEAVLVPPRVLRRVIKLEHGGGMIRTVPHRKVLPIARARLLAIVDESELGLPAGQALPEQLILLPRPLPTQLAGTLAGQVLIKYWRLIFHARVHQALDARRARGELGAAEVRARLDRIGQAEYDELRSVLGQENFLLAPDDEVSNYVEIAAVVLELRFFGPWLLPSYFPGLADIARVEEVLRADVDAAALCAAARPAGAPDPVALGTRGAQKRCSTLLRDADAAAGRGDRVRAAQLMRRAARLVPAPYAPALDVAVGAHLGVLAAELAEALHQPPERAADWTRCLAAVLAPAVSDAGGAAGRLLADLQRIATGRARTEYELDLAGHLLSGGQQPLQRELPHLRDVLVVKHLRHARRHLAHAALPAAERAVVSDALRAAAGAAERHLRARCRGPIEKALAAVGLEPRNHPERVASARVVEQVLDRIVATGFVTFSDLRDVLSRSPLKMDDVHGWADFARGTPLLRADRLLGESLAGVYRPAEIYLRGLQRASNLAFATHAGRWLTRFIALPMLGALVTLIAAEEVCEKVLRLHVDLTRVRYFLALAVFFLGVIHHPGFRAGVWRVLAAAGRALGWVLRGPAVVLSSPVFLAVYESHPVELFRHHVSRPLVASALLCGLAWLGGLSGFRLALFGAVCGFATGAFFNSRVAFQVQESVSDWVGLNWQWLSKDVLPGLFGLIASSFRALLDGVERVLYAIDSWLRFRTGESRAALWAKAVIGMIWSVIAYVTRFCVNLLIEPQINPIKHFPVVTVSHKVLLPMVPHVGGVLASTFQMDRIAANSTAFTCMSMIPGIFGFLVWELNANWKLYDANRSGRLEPLAVGSHGETMLRLMRPGFHSGTLPRAFARLRRAERRRDKRASRRHHDELHHVSETIEQFVERELVELLARSRGWGLPRLRVGEIELHSNRIRVPLVAAFADAPPLELSFEEQSGWLVASVSRPGWLPLLTERQRLTLAVALAGTYALAGVDFTREQIQLALGPERPPYDIADRGLVVWPGGDFRTEIRHELVRSAEGALPLFFLPDGLDWRAWVLFWEADLADADAKPPVDPRHVL